MAEYTACIGCLTPLAKAAASRLERTGRTVRLMDYSEAITHLQQRPPAELVIFPFAPSMRRGDLESRQRQLDHLRDVLRLTGPAGVRRVVLRSHAFTYGSSWKNYGLMEEDRPSLLPQDSLYTQWLQAEKHVLELAGSCLPVILRFTSILEPQEGDFLVHMLRRRVNVPVAGHDPRVQFLALDDAAQAVVQALESNASGIFNIAPDGVVSLRDALKASSLARLPVGRLLQKPVRELFWRAGLARFPGESAELLRYNWTVSSEAARTHLGFTPAVDTRTALLQFLQQHNLGDGRSMHPSYDDFGLSPEYLHRMRWWFAFLRKVYWRVEDEGTENIAASGAGLLVSNHRGFMPFDGVVHRSLILEKRRRHVRFLVIPSLFKFPFLSEFLIRQGGVVASQQNTARLFQRGELVGIFPEGINGAFRMYKGAYRLGALGRDAYARMAIEHQVPIYPAATIGHVEIFPILAKIHISAMTRWNGWPFLPVTPTFPLIPLPLPSKWHIRYLEPIHPTGLSPADAGNNRKVKEFSAHFRDVLQHHIDDMLARRKHIFFGKIFDRPVENPPVNSAVAGD